MCSICDGGTEEELDDLVDSCITGEPGWFVMGVYDGRGEVRFGSVHDNHWLTDRFNAWKGFYRARRARAPAKAALQLIWLNDRGDWQDDPVDRRWRYERLDRAPHLPSYRGRRR